MHLNDDDLQLIKDIYVALNKIEGKKQKNKIKNILFAYYSARETQSINRSVALVSYVATLDAISNYYQSKEPDKTCPSCGMTRSKNRNLMLDVICNLLGLQDGQREDVNKWLGRIYGKHRSGYVHSANISFEEYSQNMDGKNFAGLPKAIPTLKGTVTEQYQYESDFSTLQSVSQALIIKHLEKVSGSSILAFKMSKEVNFLGNSVPEVHIGLVNNGWVRAT